MPSTKRKAVACERCHSRKVKCQGGDPCNECGKSGRQCVFPHKDKLVTVSEAYIRQLQAQAMSSTTTLSPLNTGMPFVAPRVEAIQAVSPQSPHSRRNEGPELGDNTAESFVSGLKQLGSHLSSSTYGRQICETLADGSPRQSQAEKQYEFVTLSSDSHAPPLVIQLPPVLYARQLLDQFEKYVGHDYHWHCKSTFRAMLESTYRDPSSSAARDRTWLSQLLVVLALGASYGLGPDTHVIVGDGVPDTADSSTQVVSSSYVGSASLPGAEFFEQALSLFKMPTEQPKIAHVEALNLITFYCYSLNRRRAAYMYAGMAARIAHALLMDRLPIGEEDAVSLEHRNRLFWTTVILDFWTASALGLRPLLRLDEIQVGLPSRLDNSMEYGGQFGTTTVFAMHVKLCKCQIENIGWRSRLDSQEHWDEFSASTRVALRRLEQWRSECPAEFTLDRVKAISQQTLEWPEMRSLASIYLRYDHAIVTLLRPVFFKLMTSIIQGETDATFLDGHHDLSVECLAAARCSLQILQKLAEADRIAKYGFWESLHIFSSLTITTLATLVNKTRPYSFDTSELDEQIISNCNHLLADMAAAGNLAARSHQKMLQDIENSLGPIFAGPQSQQVDAALQWADMEAELLQWTDPFDESFGLPSNDFLAFTPTIHDAPSTSKQ